MTFRLWRCFNSEHLVIYIHILDLLSWHARANFVHLIGFPCWRCISRSPWTSALQVSGQMENFKDIRMIIINVATVIKIIRISRKIITLENFK